MFQDSWMQEIDDEQFPEPYRSIAKDIGKEAMLKLAAKFQGTGMYFPKLDSLIQEARNKRIRAEFNGGNHKELAIKYNITEVWVRNILAQRDNPNQMSIFQFTGTAT